MRRIYPCPFSRTDLVLRGYRSDWRGEPPIAINTWMPQANRSV